MQVTQEHLLFKVFKGMSQTLACMTSSMRPALVSSLQRWAMPSGLLHVRWHQKFIQKHLELSAWGRERILSIHDNSWMHWFNQQWESVSRFSFLHNPKTMFVDRLSEIILESRKDMRTYIWQQTSIHKIPSQAGQQKLMAKQEHLHLYLASHQRNTIQIEDLHPGHLLNSMICLNILWGLCNRLHILHQAAHPISRVGSA